jgi:hypothetical protein
MVKVLWYPKSVASSATFYAWKLVVHGQLTRSYQVDDLIPFKTTSKGNGWSCFLYLVDISLRFTILFFPETGLLLPMHEG